MANVVPAGACRHPFDDVVGRADAVGLLADFPAALGMDDDLNAGIVRANLVHMLRQKALVHRAVALPQNYLGLAQPLGGQPALQHVRVPHHHFVQRNAAGESGVAAQVLIGQEEESFRCGEGPVERALGIGRGADQPAALAAECLDRRCGVHVGDGRDAVAFVVGQAEATNCSQASSTWPISAMSAMEQPALRSGRIDRLARTRQDVGAFRHEMHAAKNDVAALGLRGHLRQP